MSFRAIAQETAKAGGTACAVMNAANEAAVARFLREEIGFYDIPDAIACALDAVPQKTDPTLEEILDADRSARAAVAAKFGN